MPRETVRLIYCVAKRDRRRRFYDAVRALDGIDRKYNKTTHRKGIPQEHQSPPANIYLHEADRNKSEKKRCFGSVRYANGEYAAEQPQGLPAVIAELTRWAAQNMELTFK